MTAFAPTYLDLQQRTIFALGLDYGNSDDMDAVRNAINSAQNLVATDSRFFASSGSGSALAAAATSQALPSGIVEAEFVGCTFNSLTPLLRYVGFERILYLRGTASTSGPPTVYTLRKNTVEFWPNASGGEVLTTYGTALPDALSAGTDVSGLPEPYGSNLMVYGACIEVAEARKDPLLPSFEASYQTWMRRFQAYLNRRRSRASQAFTVAGADGVPLLPHDPSTDLFDWR